MKAFQLVILLFFGAMLLLAVLIFSGIIPVGQDSEQVLNETPVVAWGTMDFESFSKITRAIRDDGGPDFNISYSQKSLASFESELVNALASGTGPDLIFANHDLLMPQEDKFFLIPYESISLRDFRSAFVDVAGVYERSTGVLGLPLIVDPVVMYWNQDLFRDEGLVEAPSSWLELQTLAETLSKKDERNNILQSAVALGSPQNISHLREVISSLILQTGDPIVNIEPFGDRDVVMIELGSLEGDAASVVRYVADFSNPALNKYSWNSAKQNSIDEFIAGRLAIYFGLSSDLPVIQERNPHLSFDVALLPQLDDGKRTTYANTMGVAVLRNSNNINAALTIAANISMDRNNAEKVSNELSLAPAHRRLLSKGSGDVYQSIFFDSAIISSSWPDPDSGRSEGIFSNMIENVIINRSTAQQAVTNANSLLGEILR